MPPQPTSSAMTPQVSRAVAWSDGGAEFVFSDGSVLAFSQEMETFAAASSATASPVELCVTSLCLSKYHQRVRAALGVFNSFNPQPRLLEGLVPENLTVKLWRGASPIDALVLSTDPSLFSVRSVNQQHQQGGDVVSHATFATLHCAMRKVSLTLHPTRRVFSVKWPSRVVSQSGSSYLYVSPTDAQGNITSLSATERVQPYVELEQLFPVLNPPVQWAHMLDMALEHDRMYSENPSAFDTPPTGESEAPALAHRSMMLTLPQPLVFSTSPAHSQIRFPSLAQEDAHALVASTEIQNLTCQSERLHTAVTALMGTGGTVGGHNSFYGRLLGDRSYGSSGHSHKQPGQHPLPTVLWRLDGDPQERSPHCVYWCMGEQQWAYANPPDGAFNAYGGGGVNARKYLRDCSIKGTSKQPYEYRDASREEQQEEQRRRSQFDPSLEGVVEAFVAEDMSVVSMCPSTTSTFVVAHTRSNRSVEEYRYDPSDESVSLPSSLPPTSSTPPPSAAHATGADGVFFFLPAASMVSSIPAPTSHTQMLRTGLGEVHACYPLRGGRYLPPVGYSAATLSLCHRRRCGAGANPLSGGNSQQQQLLPQQHSEGITNTTNTSNKLVVCESRVEGVGTFTALYNGTIRGCFDDRTILTLIPDDNDTESGLVAQMLLPDATTRHCRVVQCTPDNAAYHYLQYLLPFRRYAKMSEVDRQAAFGVGPQGPPPSAVVMGSRADGASLDMSGNPTAGGVNGYLPGMNQSAALQLSNVNTSYNSSSSIDRRRNISSEPAGLLMDSSGPKPSGGGQLDIDVLLFHTRQMLTASQSIRDRNHSLLKTTTSEDPYFTSTITGRR